MVVFHTNLACRNLCKVLLFQQLDNVVETSLFQYLLAVLVDVKRYDGQILAQLAALQIEDVGERIDGYSQWIAADGCVDETVVA